MLLEELMKRGDVKFREVTMLVRCPLNHGGYTRIEQCELCEFCVEFHIDNVGVFCSYPKVLSDRTD